MAAVQQCRRPAAVMRLTCRRNAPYSRDMSGARPARAKQPDAGAKPPAPRRISTGKLVVIAVLVTVGMLGWWLWKNPPGAQEAAPSPTAAVSMKPNRFGPAVVTAERVAGLPKELDQPVYWAGELAGKSYQLTISDDGAVGLRYLNPSNDDPKQEAITVATQPNSDAYDVAAASRKWLFEDQSGAAGSGSPSASALMRAQLNPDGSLVFLDPASTSVGHLVREDLPYLVTVYAPEPGQTWQLLSSGAITPIPD